MEVLSFAAMANPNFALHQNQNPYLKPIVIRDVWATNMDFEFNLIRILLPRYSYVSMDTEFPGVVFKLTADCFYSLKPSERYCNMKMNVDALKLIQVGITLSDIHGNIPDMGSSNRFVWQFNFNDFNISHDLHAPDSIELLKQQGIDFAKHRELGINSYHFAALMIKSGLVCNRHIFVRWVSFHGSYDFAYLVKILTCRPLPANLNQFMAVLNFYFGSRLYDVKHLMKFCGFHGGLEKVAKLLNVDRSAGKAHCAGSDSLLTWQVFEKIRKRLPLDCNGIIQGRGVLFGLEWYEG